MKSVPYFIILYTGICLLVYKSLCLNMSNMKSTIFWDITPRSPLSVNRRFGGTHHLHLHGRKISRARNQSESRWQVFFALKKEAIFPSETSVDTQRTTPRYIPENGTLHNHRCENFKFHMSNMSCVLIIFSILLALFSRGHIRNILSVFKRIFHGFFLIL
jgi:hypothetical protein